MTETTRKGEDYPGNFLRRRLWTAAFDAERDGLTALQMMKEFAGVMAEIPATFPPRQSHPNHKAGG